MIMSPKQKEAYERLGYNLSRATMSKESSYYSEGGSFPNPEPDFAKAFRVVPLSNPHPWTSDLRVMQRMLNNEIELPHGSIEFTNFINDTVWYESTPHVIFISSCDECKRAFMLRWNYNHIKERVQ